MRLILSTHLTILFLSPHFVTDDDYGYKDVNLVVIPESNRVAYEWYTPRENLRLGFLSVHSTRVEQVQFDHHTNPDGLFILSSLSPPLEANMARIYSQR